jgi:hypothetical protein
MVNGPDMSAPPEPALSALLHPKGVRRVRAKRQSASLRAVKGLYMD